MYACVDDNLLTWHRQNQSLIRSDLSKRVIDAIRIDDAVRHVGEPIILKVSYHRDNRHVTIRYQV